MAQLDVFVYFSKVYATPPENLDDIERKIQRDMDNLRQNRPMGRRAVFGMIRTARLCMNRNGERVEDCKKLVNPVLVCCFVLQHFSFTKDYSRKLPNVISV